MILGYDLSNLTGPADAGRLVELRNRYDLRRAIVAWQSTDWMDACIAAKVPFEMYGYLYNAEGDYGSQVLKQANVIRQYLPSRLWLDIEDETVVLPTANEIDNALSVAFGLVSNVGIYTGAWYWQLLGNPDFGGKCPLWLANYTNTPPIEPDGFNATFGGWVSAPVVQYAGSVTLLGLNLDLDAWRHTDIP